MAKIRVKSPMFHVNRHIANFCLIDILKLDSGHVRRRCVLPRGGVNYLASTRRTAYKLHFVSIVLSIDFERTAGCE